MSFSIYSLATEAVYPPNYIKRCSSMRIPRKVKVGASAQDSYRANHNCVVLCLEIKLLSLKSYNGLSLIAYYTNAFSNN